jgi:Tol biopolymer transport system component
MSDSDAKKEKKYEASNKMINSVNNCPFEERTFFVSSNNRKNDDIFINLYKYEELF